MKRLLIATLLGTTMLTAPALTKAVLAATSDHVVEASKSGDASYQKLMKISQDGYNSYRAVRGARIAIFNGTPDKASKLVDEALNDVTAASKKAGEFVGRTNGKVSDTQKDVGDLAWVPVDASLDLSDDFVMTDKKKEHIAKANKHFKNGEKDKAVEALKLADVDVTYSRVLMPLKTTEKHIKSAKDLLSQKKYYEANLALKAAEDGLIVDVVDLVDLPKTASSQDNSKTVAKTQEAQKPAKSTQ